MKKKKVTKNESSEYFSETRTWETDKVIALKKSTRTAWIIAAIASITAIAAIFAVAGLTPLKKSIPHLLKVDNSTGIVEEVAILEPQFLTAPEEVKKFFLRKYVRCREGFVMALASNCYRFIGASSSPMEQKKFFDYFNPESKKSPLNIYGENFTVEIDVKSVTFPSEDLTFVRYLRTETNKGTNQRLVSHWQATMRFGEIDKQTDTESIKHNPLGLKITDFRTDRESKVDIYQEIKPASTPEQLAEKEQQEAEQLLFGGGEQ